MSGDQPACRITRWLSMLAGVAALIAIVYGLSGRAHVAGSPQADETGHAQVRIVNLA